MNATEIWDVVDGRVTVSDNTLSSGLYIAAYIAYAVYCLVSIGKISVDYTCMGHNYRTPSVFIARQNSLLC